ncbi:MAG: thioredoxin family protein [Acidobacteriia bacterium]|nr:thioredoxin family protein [Terriglobia bacterium]
MPAGLGAALEQWKTAVSAGDKSALQALYSTNPPGYVVSSDGKQQLPVSAESDFWEHARAAGLDQLAVSVVKTEDRNGLSVVTLELSFRSKTPAGMRQGYVLEQQGWQQQSQGWRIVASTHTPVLKMRPVGKLNPHLYEKDADAKAEIREALAKAARTHKRVLLVFGGNWCYDCHVLEAAFHQVDVSPLLNRNFMVVHVDIGQMDKNLDLAQKYRVPIKKGVPALAVLAPDGTLLYSQQHGEFESARNMDPDDLIAFLNKWKPAAAR